MFNELNQLISKVPCLVGSQAGALYGRIVVVSEEVHHAFCSVSYSEIGCTGGWMVAKANISSRDQHSFWNVTHSR